MTGRLTRFKLLVRALKGSMAGSSIQKKNKKGKFKYTSSSSPYAMQVLTGLILSVILGAQTLSICIKGLPELSKEAGFDYISIAIVTDILIQIGFTWSFIVNIFFFSKSDEVLVSYPIKPFELFLARAYLSLGYSLSIDLMLFVHSVIYISFFSPSFLAYVGLIVCTLTVPLISVCLGFVVVNFFGKILNFRKHQWAGRAVTIFFSLIGGLSYLLITLASDGETAQVVEQSVLASYQRYSWILWLGYIPTRAMIEASPADGLFIIYQLLILACSLGLAYVSATHYYISNLGNEGEKKRKPLTKEKEAQVYKVSFKRRGKLGIYLRREKLLFKRSAIAVTYSFITPTFVAIAMFATLFSLKYSADTQSAFAGYFAEPGIAFAMIGGGLAFSTSFPFFSYSSVSAEGKGIYTLKSMPLDYSPFLDAKAIVGAFKDALVLIVLASVFVFGLRVNPVVLVYLLISLLPLILIYNEASMVIGIKYAVFDYDNLNEVVQRGWGPFISWLVYLLILAVGIFIPSISIIYSQGTYAVLINILTLLVEAAFEVGVFFLLREQAKKKFTLLMAKDI
jgi:ABC-2 type transport system permease protein